MATIRIAASSPPASNSSRCTGSIRGSGTSTTGLADVVVTTEAPAGINNRCSQQSGNKNHIHCEQEQKQKQKQFALPPKTIRTASLSSSSSSSTGNTSVQGAVISQSPPPMPLEQPPTEALCQRIGDAPCHIPLTSPSKQLFSTTPLNDGQGQDENEEDDQKVKQNADKTSSKSSSSGTMACTNKDKDDVEKESRYTVRKCYISSVVSSPNRPSKRSRISAEAQAETSAMNGFINNSKSISGSSNNNVNNNDNGSGSSNNNSLAGVESTILPSLSKVKAPSPPTSPPATIGVNPETPLTSSLKRSARIKKRKLEAPLSSPLSYDFSDSNDDDGDDGDINIGKQRNNKTEDTTATSETNNTTNTAATISTDDDNENDNDIDNNDDLKVKTKIEKNGEMIADDTGSDYTSNESLSSIINNGCTTSNIKNERTKSEDDNVEYSCDDNTDPVSLMKSVFTSKVMFTWTEFRVMNKREQEILWLTEASSSIVEEILTLQKENSELKKLKRKRKNANNSFTLNMEEERRKKMVMEHIQEFMSDDLKQHIESMRSRSSKIDVSSCSLLIRSCVRLLQPDVKCEFIEKRKDVRRFIQKVIHRIKNNEHRSIASLTKRRLIHRINTRWKKKDVKYSNKLTFTAGEKVFLFEENGDSDFGGMNLTCYCAEVLGTSPLPSFSYSVMLDDSTVEHGIVRESVFISRDFEDMKNDLKDFRT